MKTKKHECSYCFGVEEPLKAVHKDWIIKDIYTGKDYNLICPKCWVAYGKYKYPERLE